MPNNIIQKKITKKLKDSLNPEILYVFNESYLHIHHNNNISNFNGETHFRVVIVSSFFMNIKKISRHRIINILLKNEIENNIHSLSIDAKSPQDYKIEN